MDLVMESVRKNTEGLMNRMYEDNYPILQVFKEINLNVPQQLKIPVDLAMNTKLTNLFKSEKTNVSELKNVLDAAERIDAVLDLVTLNYLADAKVKDLMKRLYEIPEDGQLIQDTLELVGLIEGSRITPEYWEAQNLAFAIKKRKVNDFAIAREEAFTELLNKLQITV